MTCLSLKRAAHLFRSVSEPLYAGIVAFSRNLILAHTHIYLNVYAILGFDFCHVRVDMLYEAINPCLTRHENVIDVDIVVNQIRPRADPSPQEQPPVEAKLQR